MLLSPVPPLRSEPVREVGTTFRSGAAAVEAEASVKGGRRPSRQRREERRKPSTGAPLTGKRRAELLGSAGGPLRGSPRVAWENNRAPLIARTGRARSQGRHVVRGADRKVGGPERGRVRPRDWQWKDRKRRTLAQVERRGGERLTTSARGEHDWACRLGESLLARALPRRWSHSLGVGRQALHFEAVVGENADALVAAALLHDVGYAPDLAVTGFHALDGARYLRGLGVEERVVRLVAHHSCAGLEAEVRGLASELAEFQRPEPLAGDVLTYCDMITTPDGRVTDVASRLAEIVERSGRDSVVGKFIAQAGGDLRSAVARVGSLLVAAGAQPM